MSGEIWKPVAGYEGVYEVSSHGRVRSLDRFVAVESDIKGCYRSLRKGRVLADCTDRDGYRLVSLSCRGVVRGYKVHRLVAIAFLPPRPDAPEVNHKDFCKTNNRANNLEWATAAENSKHGCAEGARVPKLTAAQVARIRELHAAGFDYAQVAQLFDVSKQTIYRICQRKTWRKHGVTSTRDAACSGISASSP